MCMNDKCHVHLSQILLKSHVTTHLSQSEGSILSSLSDLVKKHEISLKNFPPPPYLKSKAVKTALQNANEIDLETKGHSVG